MGKRGRKSLKKTQEPSESEEEYEIEKILDRRTRNGVVEYFLKWKGFSSLENSWEPEDNLNCQDLIKEFNVKFDEKKPTKSDSDTEADEPQQKRSKVETAEVDVSENTSEAKDDSDGTAEDERTDRSKEQESEEEKKKKKSRSINRGSSGFDRGWEVDEILGATHSYGKLHFLISWKGKEQADLVPAKIAHKKSPQAVIDYYEARLQWCDRDEKTENNNKSSNDEAVAKEDT